MGAFLPAVSGDTSDGDHAEELSDAPLPAFTSLHFWTFLDIPDKLLNVNISTLYTRRHADYWILGIG